MAIFSDSQLRRARKADLYSFLTRNFPDEYKVEGNSIRPRSNHSISVKRGYSGYVDFSNGKHGNSIDYLVRHLDYTVEQAVYALIDDNEIVDIKSTNSDIRVRGSALFPDRINGDFDILYNYMIYRGISRSTIDRLICEGLIYQEAKYNNIVFGNSKRDWGEIRGTYGMFSNRYHGIVKNSKNDGFWSFAFCNNPDKIFICESAIDAISLYEIHRSESIEVNSIYASIGGSSKQNTINRLKSLNTCIIAVDNDEAGDYCRRRNVDCDKIIPINKDWNEDLCRIYVQRQGLVLLSEELPF